jgi:7-cyano-7-deazaguanine synthase
MSKSLVLLSGGVDSSTCLALAVRDYGAEKVIALSVTYGQKHVKELQAAADVADYYKVPLKTLDLTPVFKDADCSLLSHSETAIPEKSYAEQINDTGGINPVSTYVPFRNGLFISAAASVALSNGCDTIFYGAHKDDSAGNAYPDCSPAFFEAMNNALVTGSSGGVRLCAPFINVNKTAIVRLGKRLGVPYDLTWSCYAGGDTPCGKCGTCIDRARAFEEAETVTDTANETATGVM